VLLSYQKGEKKIKQKIHSLIKYKKSPKNSTTLIVNPLPVRNLMKCNFHAISRKAGKNSKSSG
jgi:hypothetical protein